MVAILALYGRPKDEREFLRYYEATHAPLAKALPGLQSYRHGRVYGGSEDTPLAWYAAVLTFRDRAGLDAALASDQGKQVAGDLANFATGGVQLLFAEHEES